MGGRPVVLIAGRDVQTLSLWILLLQLFQYILEMIGVELAQNYIQLGFSAIIVLF
jgi:hypothetical protein